MLATNRGLQAVGLRKRPDGWRRAAGQLLRGEESSFVLSAFGLDPWSRVEGGLPLSATVAEVESHVAAHLDAFFKDVPLCRVRLRRERDEDVPAACAPGEKGWTVAFAPWHEGPERFVMPRADAWGAAWCEGGDRGTSPLFNVVCRVDPSGRRGCDVWVRVNHAGTDGVPMQEVLTRLEATWGTAAPVVFPTAEEFAPFEHARRAGGLPEAGELAELQFFADFSPLMAWRKAQNQTLGTPMTLAAALLWRMSQLDQFRGSRIGTTVEVGAGEGRSRGVGVVVVRPRDYTEAPGGVGRLEGLGRYVTDFNKQVELNRAGAADGCRTLAACALLPAGLGRGVLRAVLTHTSKAFGAVVVTVVKDAKVFGAPVGEVGHPQGFIAIGGVGLPTAHGGKVGSVTVKGPRGVVEGYPRLIRAAIAGGGGARGKRGIMTGRRG